MEFIAASDCSLLVRLAPDLSVGGQRRTQRLFRSMQGGSVRGVKSLSPAYASLLIRFDPRETNHEALRCAILESAHEEGSVEDFARLHDLPVLYDGPDILEVASLHQLSPADVVDLHSGPEYSVYFLGFLPGFAYMGDLPAQLITPRRATPRPQVPRGSVGVANSNTGVYPVAAPGGWNLLGRCPTILFDLTRLVPSLLSPGDTVRFHPVSATEFGRLTR